MNELIRIAETILGFDFPDRRDVDHNLYACLAGACPPEGDGPASREARFVRYLELREQVLARLTVPVVPSKGATEPSASENDLRAVLRETRREIVRRCRIALFWSHAEVIPWYDHQDRALYANGVKVNTWSGHAPENGPQLRVLAAFQEEEWRSAIFNPLAPLTSSTDTCRKLNKAVGKFIRFGVAGNCIRWCYPR